MNSNILVVDLEATCWDDKIKQGSQVNEIIEIGYSILDLSTLKILETNGIMVKPTTSKISEFCTALTTIKPEDVELAMSYDQALDEVRKVIRKYATESWCSYGDYDRSMFRRQCEREKLANPMPTKHLNISHVIEIINGGHRMGMSKALKFLKLPLVGTHHRGKDDAYNIAQILATLTGMCRFEIKQGK